MDHAELREKCRKALPPKLPVDVKPHWAIFVKEERTEFFFRYEWIKDRRIFDWISAQPELDIHDGQEWFGVYIVDKDGSPINRYAETP